MQTNIYLTEIQFHSNKDLLESLFHSVTRVDSAFIDVHFNLSDIQFWRSRKSLEGLSVRSVFFNVFQSLIVVLYVLDNETNMVVVVSCCIGLVIEFWKITKVVDIKVYCFEKLSFMIFIFVYYIMLSYMMPIILS